MTKRVSVEVLEECIALQNKKANDYQNDVSSVRQADYYRLGVDSIYDMMHTKMLRIKSLMETAKANSGAAPNFESLEDTAKDLINYASFFAAWLRGGIDGQNPNVDMFNRPVPKNASNELVKQAADILKSPQEQERLFAEGLIAFAKDKPNYADFVKAAAAYLETGVAPEGTRGLLDADYPSETVVGQSTGKAYNPEALKAIHDPDHVGERVPGEPWNKPV